MFRADVLRTVSSMTTQTLSRTVDHPLDGAIPVPMPRREQLAFIVFAVWAIAGLFVDGWSHRHGRPNTFFTPWHAVLYSGIAAGAIWAPIDGYRRRRAGEVLPGFDVAGARVSALGVVLLLAGGVGDMMWHTVFGIEQDVAALLSPTHLLLMLGGMLAVSGPLRAAWATDTDRSPSLRAFVPVVVSAALVAALASFFTMFASPFLVTRLTMNEYQAQEVGVAGILVATVVLLVPVIVLTSRWSVPRGTFTVYFGIVAGLVGGLEGYHRWPLLLPLLMAGVTADVLVRRGASISLLSAAVPAVLWVEYFAIFFATGGMRWSADLWLGSAVMASLLGYGLAQLTRARRTW
jgi:hypothetical protein